MTTTKETFEKWLPVKLNNHELIARGKQMAKFSQDRKQLEGEKAENARAFAQRIKNLSGEIDKLETIVDTGNEDRHIKCVREWRYDDKEVVVYRTDTLETIERRALREDETQIKLQTADGIDAPF